MRAVGKRFGLHPLLLDDVLATGHRPVIEDYDDCVFILLRLLGYDEERKRVLAEQVSLTSGDGVVLTFQERESNLWDCVATRLEKGVGRQVKRSQEHLTHALISAILDEYILTLGRLAEDIEEIEQALLAGADGDILTEIYRLKREVLFLHRSLWPLREVLGRFVKDASESADSVTALLWSDIQQDVYQVLDAVETLREMLSEMVGLSMRMAEIIAGLSGVAYSARAAVNSIKNLAQAKRAVRRAFETQVTGEGFGFVEILATCPTNWKMSSTKANERIAKEMIPGFPLGVFKDVAKED